MAEPKKKRVILIHGIREHADWFAKVRNALKEAGIDEVETIGYGYFNVVQFLLPGTTREYAERDVAQQIVQVQLKYPNDDLSIIAFSFGTHLAAKALLNNPNLTLKHLILCGAVASKRFSWSQIAKQVERRILNECGVKDPWPIVAETVTVGFSRSGSSGIQRAGVDDRFHDAAHQTDFVRDGRPIYFEWAKIIAADCEPARDTDERSAELVRMRPKWFKFISPVGARVAAAGALAAAAAFVFEPQLESLADRCLWNCDSATMTVHRVIDFSDARCVDGQRDRTAIAWDTLRFSKYQTYYVATWIGAAGEHPPILTNLRTLEEVNGDALSCGNGPPACSIFQYNVEVRGHEARLAWRYHDHPRVYRFSTPSLPVPSIRFEARLPRGVTLTPRSEAAPNANDDGHCRSEGDALVCTYAGREGGVLRSLDSESREFATTQWDCR